MVRTVTQKGPILNQAGSEAMDKLPIDDKDKRFSKEYVKSVLRRRIRDFLDSLL